MPRRAARACSTPGCPNLVRGEARLCRVCSARQRRAQDARRPTAAARGYGEKWRRLRASYLARHPACAACGGMAVIVHHIVRKRNGGSDEDDNLIALCRSCHSYLHAKTGESWGMGVKIAGQRGL
ncbi:MAG: HNH endonuclease [Anaerolineae bacterium]|nr:HNH endonuclease [Anaerolineae bacterium]